jgi:hypothetical protein
MTFAVDLHRDDAVRRDRRAAQVPPTGAGTGKLTGRLVFPEDPGYADDRRIWNLQFNPYPLVIVFCQNADDVVNAITWSRQHDVAFRARGGRHALEGWSSIDGGVIIDVSEMQDIKLGTDTQLATVQTGLPQDAIVNAARPQPRRDQRQPGRGSTSSFPKASVAPASSMRTRSTTPTCCGPAGGWWRQLRHRYQLHLPHSPH